MLKVGLTGGIACGKSSVLAIFASLGAHVQRADEVGHRLMSPGEPVYRRIVEAFGPQILSPDGAISRPALAAAAFPNRIAELNAIVHPAVLAYENEWMRSIDEAEPAAIAICEAALLIEAGGRARFDRLIVVTCSLEQKIARFAERAGIGPEAARAEVARRMAAQMPEAEKAKLADYVIDNSGSREELEAETHKISEELRRLAR